MATAIGTGEAFDRGRDFAAWLGLVPRQCSTGGKPILGHISKRGWKYLRTLFIYIAGDNGTSGEGGPVGMFNEMTYFNAVAEKTEELLPELDEWGGPTPSLIWRLVGRLHLTLRFPG